LDWLPREVRALLLDQYVRMPTYINEHDFWTRLYIIQLLL